ncbi:MAG: PEGA domain-containing protein [Sandaracinaceae bacterium]|jgi:hypothetical protein|nr:PEGA domain-containing protein [Sandaracinaceae bacterium]
MIRHMLAAGLFFALTLGAGIALAQDAEVEQARANFNHGVELYGASDYTGALASFQEAYRLRPHPTVRVNMANCYDHLNRPVEAIFHFEHYLSESGRNAPAQQRREVETALVALRQRVGQLTLRIAPDGATVRIDDTEERRAPVLEPVTLTAGTHHITVTLNGYRSEARTIEVEGGHGADLALRLERGAEPTIATNPAQNPLGQTPGQSRGDNGVTTHDLPDATITSETRTPNADQLEQAENDRNTGLHMTTTTWIVGGVSAGAIVIACITGAMASGANADFDEDVARANDTSLSEAERNAAIRAGHSDASRANTLATVTDVLGIAGAIGVGVAVTMFFLSGDDHPDQQQARVVAAPMFSQDSAGVTVRGSF